MNDELVCDELVQKINDSCAQFEAQMCQVDEPMVRMTVDLQNQQFEHLIAQSGLANLEINKNFRKEAPELLLKFDTLVAKMKDLCDENCSNIQRHYMKEKYDMLFCYK